MNKRSALVVMVAVLASPQLARGSCSSTNSLAGNWQFFSEGIDAANGHTVECTMSLTGDGALVQGACRHRDYNGKIVESFSLTGGDLNVTAACAVTGSFSYTLTDYAPRQGTSTTPISKITFSTARMDKTQSNISGIAWNRDEYYYNDLRDGPFTMVAY